MEELYKPSGQEQLFKQLFKMWEMRENPITQENGLARKRGRVQEMPKARALCSVVQIDGWS